MLYDAKLNLREKIAQMIIAGIDGTTAGDAIKALIQKTKVGGVILYKKNTPTAKSTMRLTGGLQALARETGAPLIIAIDEEHGRVKRIQAGTTRLVDMASVGRLNDAEVTKKIAAITSRELLVCGVNLNFAPVCDVNINPKNEVIGDRSFSPDPHIAADMVSAYITEGLRTGMILCAKHFPGHGDTSIDSHFALPVVNKTYEELAGCELIPFEAAIKAKVQTIMTAHIRLPKIDDLPATMSKRIITGILRDKLGFDGVIISDDMEMGAIAKNYGALEAFTFAVNAGVNMFIVSGMINRNIRIDELVNKLAKAAADGNINKSMIDSSVEKILRLKSALTNRTYDESVLREKKSLEFAALLKDTKRRIDGKT